jgi:alkyl sulfatase BDS1-like metallo-beta-lactamase superfamily hydrolase
MTIVEGMTGLIVIDTLTTPGAAREALDLYFAHRPRKPVVAVIYSHSHPDHYGGVSGVVSQAEVVAGKIKLIAPAGFLEAVVGEAVMGGNAKARRGQYQFGMPLPIGEGGTSMKALARTTLGERADSDRLSHQTIPFSSRWRPARSME